MFFLFSLFSLISSKIHLNEEKSFVSWMRETHNFYTGEDYFLRYGIWSANKRFIQEHNTKNRGYKLKINHLSSLTPSEYRLLLGNQNSIIKYRGTQKIKNLKKKGTPNVSSLDWRDSGVVSPIADQGICGSDWAFAAITTSESVHAISSGTLVPLSVQNLMDCVTICYGCYGGLASYALTYVVNNQNGKINTAESYPYQAAKNDCKFDDETAIQAISSWTQVDAGDESQLSQFVEEYGPAAAVLDASLATFQSYSSGIYDDEGCSSVDVNHAVGVVGFGVEGSVSYWIIKNSMSTAWGEEGYMRLIWKENRCGIASLAIVAIA